MIKFFAASFAFLFCASACDPMPKRDYVPPGGFAKKTDDTGTAAIRAVLVTPSHGTFRTVREALSTYIGRADQNVTVAGWSAEAVTTDAVKHYDVAFAWNDGERKREAKWELNGWGIWPLNNEARILSVYPPEEGR